MRGNLTHAPATDLTARIRTVLDACLHRRQDEALTLIEQRHSVGRVASGMPAARTTRPEMMAVDESLFYPARLSDDGDTLTPSENVEHPDAIDELIQLVLIHGGGWILFTKPGALDHHHDVALTTPR